MNIVTHLDTQTLSQLLRNHEYDQAKSLLLNHYNRANRNLINKVGNSKYQSIDEINYHSSTIRNWDILKEHKIGISKIKYGMWFTGCFALTIAFTYFYLTGQAGLFITLFIGGGLGLLGTLLFGWYVFFSREVRFIFKPSTFQSNYIHKATLNWDNILTAFLYTDYGNVTDYRILIHLKNSSEPEEFNITDLAIDSQVFGLVIKKYLEKTKI